MDVFLEMIMQPFLGFDGIVQDSSNQATVRCARGCTSGYSRRQGRAPRHGYAPPNARDRRTTSSFDRRNPSAAALSGEQPFAPVDRVRP